LREGDRIVLTNWKEYIKQLFIGFRSLPFCRANLFRGICGAHIDRSIYQPGAMILFPGFSSTSTSENIARGFAGKLICYINDHNLLILTTKGPNGVLFRIQSNRGRNVIQLSAFPVVSKTNYSNQLIKKFRKQRLFFLLIHSLVLNLQH
jgi:hypothetical protein